MLLLLPAFLSCSPDGDPGKPTKPSGAKKKGPEHAVIVHIKLSNDSMGTEKERKDLQALEERLENAINAKRAGEFDGNEFGEGFCTLYMYGPDANALFASVEPGLRAANLPKGSYAIKRFGSAGDPQAREERIDLKP